MKPWRWRGATLESAAASWIVIAATLLPPAATAFLNPNVRQCATNFGTDTAAGLSLISARNANDANPKFQRRDSSGYRHSTAPFPMSADLQLDSVGGLGQLPTANRGCCHPLGKKTTERIPTLDGWRAVAIAMVIVSHAAVGSAREFPFGAAGVDVFFAISGLLITWRFLAEWDACGSISLRAFYIRRAFRILPPALSYLAIVGALGLFRSKWDAISCLTFWRNYLPQSSPTSHFWSLSLEEQFYLIWPAILILAGLRRAPRWLFHAILAVCAWRVISPLCLGGFARDGTGKLILFWDDMHTDMRADGLLWGCLAAFAFRAGRPRVPAWGLAACALGLGISFHHFPLVAVVPISCAGLVLGTAQNPAWSISRSLESKPLVWLGRRSYGLYIWQQPFFFHPTFHLPLIARLAFLLAITEVSYRYFELPLQALGRRLAAHCRTRPPTGLSFAFRLETNSTNPSEGRTLEEHPG